jgi:hypothetical protein
VFPGVVFEFVESEVFDFLVAGRISLLLRRGDFHFLDALEKASCMIASAMMVGTYVVARSGPADSHLLADFHVRGDVLKHEIVPSRGCIAEGAEESDQDG